MIAGGMSYASKFIGWALRLGGKHIVLPVAAAKVLDETIDSLYLSVDKDDHLTKGILAGLGADTNNSEGSWPDLTSDTITAILFGLIGSRKTLLEKFSSLGGKKRKLKFDFSSFENHGWFSFKIGKENFAFFKKRKVKNNDGSFTEFFSMNVAKGPSKGKAFSTRGIMYTGAGVASLGLAAASAVMLLKRTKKDEYQQNNLEVLDYLTENLSYDSDKSYEKCDWFDKWTNPLAERFDEKLVFQGNLLELPVIYDILIEKEELFLDSSYTNILRSQILDNHSMSESDANRLISQLRRRVDSFLTASLAAEETSMFSLIEAIDLNLDFISELSNGSSSSVIGRLSNPNIIRIKNDVDGLLSSTTGEVAIEDILKVVGDNIEHKPASVDAEGTESDVVIPDRYKLNDKSITPASVGDPKSVNNDGFRTEEESFFNYAGKRT